MSDLLTLTPKELDALRETASIGAGHAATALSLMTGQRIMISVPQLDDRARSRMSRSRSPRPRSRSPP